MTLFALASLAAYIGIVRPAEKRAVRTLSQAIAGLPIDRAKNLNQVAVKPE